MQSRTTTTINAHSLRKGDVVILTATECHIINHPTIANIDGEVGIRVEYLPTGKVSTHYFPHNEPVKILVGGNPGGGL